jgi:hypothetical protein
VNPTLSQIPASVYAVEAVDLHTLRRSLDAQLQRFVDVLHDYQAPTHDPLKGLLLAWCADFLHELKRRGGDASQIQAAFIHRLQEMMQDPQKAIPLEEEAYLGTDGRLYNKKALQVYLRSVEGTPARHRSPCQPESAVPFSADLHPMVPMMVQWLREKEALHLNQHFEEEFQQLANGGPLPSIPTARLEAIRRTQELVRGRRLERETKASWNVQLVRYREILDKTPSQDPLTEELRQWHTLFAQAVTETRAIETTVQEFMALLEEILVDAITQAPLDEAPLLGSDGFTYATNNLMLYICSTPEPARYRSPRAPDLLTPFVVAPHPAAKEFIALLRENGAYHPSAAAEELYQQLLDEQQAELLPFAGAVRAREVVAQFDAQQRVQEAELATFYQEQFEQQMLCMIDDAFAPLAAERAAHTAELHQALDAVRERDDAQGGQLLAQLDQLEAAHDALEVRIKQLEECNVQIDGAIARGQQYQQKLTQGIRDLQRAIEKRKERGVMGVVCGVALIAACFVVQIYLPQMLSVMPTSGGLKVAGTLTL